MNISYNTEPVASKTPQFQGIQAFPVQNVYRTPIDVRWDADTINIRYPKQFVGFKRPHYLELDPTLTKNGYAADAGVTGEYITSINNVYQAKYGETTYELLERYYNNKLVICNYDGKTFFLCELNEQYATFNAIYTENGLAYSQNIKVDTDNQWEALTPTQIALERDHYTKAETDQAIDSAINDIDVINGNDERE